MKRIEIINIDENQDYVVTGTNVNIDIDIWIKFASHFKDGEIELMEKYRNYRVDDIPSECLDKFIKLSKQNKIANLMIKYKDRKCSKEEHDIVKKFMFNHNLETFVASRMTKEEKNMAQKLIDDLSVEELKTYINENKDNYENLSVFDAYVLFIAKEKLHDINAIQHAEETMRRQAEAAQHLRKSLIRDFGH